MELLETIHSKLKGVTFDNRQYVIKQYLQDGCALHWVREEDNPYDSNAIAVYVDEAHEHLVGHISRELAIKCVAWITEGELLSMTCSQVTGGKAQQSYGVNIIICREK